MEQQADFLELLIKALAERVKVALLNDVDLIPKVDADAVEGLQEFVSDAIEEHMRNFTVDHNDVSGLDNLITESIEEVVDKDEIADNVVTEITRRLNRS